MGERRSRALILGILIAIMPTVWAGTEEAPEITDPAGDAQPTTANNYADIVAAWFADDASKYTVHLKLNQMPANPPPQLYYWIQFKLEPGCPFYFLSYGPNPYDFDQGTQPGLWYGRQDDCAVDNDIHRANGVVATQGSPLFTIEMPRAYANLTFRGDNLTNLTALTIDFASAGPCFSNSNPVTCGPVYSASAFPDYAETEKTYALLAGPSRPLPPEENANATGGENATMTQDDSRGSESANGGEARSDTPGFEATLAVLASAAAFAARRRK